MSRVQLAGIDVGQDKCKSAPYGEQISTQGLATCIGIVAYGKYGADTDINKVMAHCSPGNVTYVIGHEFVTQVRASGMDISGISMSCATRTVNDDGPYRMSDQDLRQTIANRHQIYPDQVTSQQIQELRAGMRRQLDSAEATAKLICMDQLGVSPTVYRRRNADVASLYPFGTVVATPSPQGIVCIDGNRVARIPDSAAPAPAASSGGNYDNSHDYGGGSASYDPYGSGGSGSTSGGGAYGSAYARAPSGNTSTWRPPNGGPGGSGNGASQRDGASSRPTGSTSQVYAASTTSRRDGPSSRGNSSRPSGNYTSSSKPSGSSGSTGSTDSTGTTRHKTSSTRRY